MSSHPHTANRIRQRLSTAWQIISGAYAYGNRVTHHVLGWLLLALLITYFVFCGAFLTLRYLVLPNIDHYKPEVERVASYFIDRPVSIRTIHASWRGLHPNLTLNDVVIHNQQGEQALVLPEVSATLSWWSVLVGELRLYTLEVSRPDLEMERDAEGRIYVAGILVNTDLPNDGRGLDWLLSQREIVIHGGWVRWLDKQRNAPELVLTDVDFLLQNKWRRHQFALNATPPASLAAPIDLRANFTHPAFSTSISDYSQWKGEVYADWRNTDLQAWKRYIDYPISLSGGVGAVRAWLNFDRGVVANFTADIALSNLTVSLGEQSNPLNLSVASGRISVGEEAAGLKRHLYSFGDHGHALTLSQFSLRTEDGIVLPSTTVSHIFTAGRPGVAEKHEFNITSLDLDALAQLSRHLPLSAEQRQMLVDFAPQGQLQDFSATWEGSAPGAGNYRLSGKFTGLALKSQEALPATATAAPRPAIPGFRGLSGEVNANQDEGKININGVKSTLYLADYFTDPNLSFDELGLRASWSFREHKQLSIKISEMLFLQDGIRGSLEGSHVLPLPLTKNQFGNMDLKLHIPQMDLSKVTRYLPAITPKDTREWMTHAMLEGQAKDVSVIIKGELDQFPFQNKKPQDKTAGIFKVTGKIENGTLFPAAELLAQDKHSPLWPKIEAIKGGLIIDRTRLQIHADSAKTSGVNLSAVNVTIADTMAGHSMLDVTGSANGLLQDMLGFVNATPVLGWIDDFTNDVRATGNARVNLKMQLPLDGAGGETVQGSLRFLGNEVQLMRTMPALSQTSGELLFSDKGFQLAGLQGNFLGGPVTLSGGTQRDGNAQIKIDGALTAEGLARSLPEQSIHRLGKKISGGTRYSALLRVRNQRPELIIDSSLVGFGLDLPAPLHKAASESMPLRLSLFPQALSDLQSQSEEIRITLGKSISARYLRQRVNKKNAPWKLVRGGIGVNLPVPQPESGLAINLSVPQLDIDAWNNTISSLLGEQNTADSNVNAGADFTDYLIPDSLGIRADELIVADKVLDKAILGASRQRGNWQVNIHSEQAIGYATWNDPSSERGAGKLTARLTSLIIPQSAASGVADIFSGKSPVTELPGLDIVADNFELRGLKLGRLELAASNAGMSVGREWRISRLAITNPDASLRASGKWIASGTGNQTSLDYELDINDAGRLLDRVGFEKLLKGGKGKMDGELSWKGTPYSLDIPSVSGNLSLKLASGQFLKVEPGVAKLLGVMSLQSLPRRLVLDFRDIFSDGFAFDGIASTATITRGIMKTDSFKMRGVNAVVLMDGTVDLEVETQNMNVVVIPEFNIGAASVVYGLAVNPVIGLGTVLAQLFLRSPLSQALTQEYQVTGPWKDPVVKKVASRRKSEAEPVDTEIRN